MKEFSFSPFKAERKFREFQQNDNNAAGNSKMVKSEELFSSDKKARI